jgi:hypothetical protein
MSVNLTRATTRGPSTQKPAGQAPVRRLGAVLVAVAAAAAFAASAAGLLADPYGDPASTAAMLRGYDAVTVLVALALAALIRPARHGSQPAVLAQLALLAYLVYTYAYYLFGTGFNDVFLLHVAVFSTSLAGMLATAMNLDTDRVTELVPSPGRVRVAAGLLALLAAALGGMWLFVGVDTALTGDVPAGSQLVETVTMVHLGIALDLALLVPWYAAAAALLWQHRVVGYAAAVVAFGSGLLHQVSYLVALPVQVAADVPGATGFDPGEPVIVLVYAAGLGLLLTRRRHRQAGALR